MKWITTCYLLLVITIAHAQQQPAKITSPVDSRIPEEVKGKLREIKTPEELEKFKFTSTSNVMSRDTPMMTIRTIKTFGFSNGQITGQIKVIKSNIGYTNDTQVTLVELCYMYCCKDAQGTEHCTQNYDTYKQWMKHPENCLSSRTTACN